MSSTRSPLRGPNPFHVLADRWAPHPVERYQHDPVGFARDCIAWPDEDNLTGYQDEILAALATEHRVAVRSLHGAGKTTTAALAVLWFAVTRDAMGVDWKALTTAGGYRQLERYLWPEIKLWAGRLRWDVIGREPFNRRTELLDTVLKLKHGQAFAAASDDPALLEGAHAAALLVVLDESKSISTDVFDAVEGAMSGTGEAFALATSTPGEPSGRFYDLCVRKPGLTDWQTFHVTLDDAIAAGRVSPGWAAQRAAQWGETSSVYQNRVLGEFAANSEDGVIPLAWVEAAIDRWREWADAGSVEPVGRHVVGVDVARGGADSTVLAVRKGPVILSLDRHRTTDDLMQTAGFVAAKLRLGQSVAVVDVIGIGAGVFDRLREQRLSVLGFNASHKATGRHGEWEFENRRAESWFHLRDLLDPTRDSSICLPDDDELIGDLLAPRWFPNSRGRILVESKDDIRKRLGRSPDAGDAVVMAFTVSSSVPSGDAGKVYYPAYPKALQEHHGPGPLFRPDPAWGNGGSIFGGDDEQPIDAPELPSWRPW